MENARVLRSGKATPSTDATPPSGQTGSTETNTWSKGTGTEDTTGNSSTHSQGRAEQIGENRAPEGNLNTQNRSASGTLVNVPVDRASSRLSILKAELELYNSELAQARAASAAASNRLEIARIELEGSNDADPPPRVERSRVEGWISEQHGNDRPAILDIVLNTGQATRPPITSRNEPRAGENVSNNSDMAMLANAIVQAVNSNRSDSAAPKFIHELPHFDGTITEWMSFKSVFCDTENMFSDVQNVARLRKALRGAARETVRVLLFTVSDPYEVMDALERRYGRPELLVLSELETIKRMPRMTEDGRDIGSFASKIANTVAAIKTLRQPQYLYSPELVSRIVNKLSIILKYKWYEFKSEHGGAPELELLSRFLNIMADQCGAMFAYETAREDRKNRSKPRGINTVRSRHSRDEDSDSSCQYESDDDTPRKTVASLNKSTKKQTSKTQHKPRPSQSPVKSKKPEKCAICAGNHSATECADFAKLSTNERWEAAKKNRLCFRCLSDSHKRFKKCKYIPCGVGGCEASHNKLLHNDSTSLPTRGNISSINHLQESNTYLKIVPVELSGPEGTLITHALLDEGSTMTLVERNVADNVITRGHSQLLSLEGVGGNRIDDPESCKVKLSIRGLCSRNLETMSANTISNLNLNPQLVSRDLVRQCSHLAEIEDELCYEKSKPTILIGQDNWHLITTRQLRVGNKNQPVASLTKLGWVLHGQDSKSRGTVALVNHLRPTQPYDPALELIRGFFSIESLGIEPRKPTSDPDQRALAILDKTCKKIENSDRYEAGLLWRTDNEEMPHNKKQALSRLYSLESKLGKSNTERTLGLIWNHARDTLGFNVNLRSTPASVIRGDTLPTKRQVTSAVMSVFDPLGLVSPITMLGKCFIQEIWRSDIDWDDPITAQHHVTRLSFISIPRLELQVAVLGSRLAESVKNESDYKIVKSYYWSDSKTVLAWIKSDPRTFKSFVAHRLAEIESLTTPADWRWVPSVDNVADDATKGIPANFDVKHRWFSGPEFIKNNPETWPREKQIVQPTPSTGEERTLKQVCVTIRHDVTDYLPKVERFSKYTRLVRAAATVLLAAEVFKAKLLKRITSTELTPSHVKLAELLLVRRSQYNSFAEDIKAIEAGRRPPKKSPFYKLSVKIDRNGILCLDSRVKGEHNLPVLHAKEGYTKLLVHHTHAVFNHGNHQTVMNELRQRYYIIGLRSTIRYICYQCQWCRTYKGVPPKNPLRRPTIRKASPKSAAIHSHRGGLFWANAYHGRPQMMMPRSSSNPQHQNLKVGDIVIIADKTMPRGVWPRGEVTQTHPGPDGRVRVTEVRTAAGLIRRPASRLIVISAT